MKIAAVCLLAALFPLLVACGGEADSAPEPRIPFSATAAPASSTALPVVEASPQPTAVPQAQPTDVPPTAVPATAIPPTQPRATPRPQPTQPPARTAPPAAVANCDRQSYPTVCIPPSPPDLDCGDIPHRRFTVRPPDPHRFDSDKDGIGCESG